MKFKRGDHVICVDDTHYYPHMKPYFSHWPRVGEMYTVRESRMVGENEGVYLEGVYNLVHPVYREECGYFAFRFAIAPRRGNVREAVARKADNNREPSRAG